MVYYQVRAVSTPKANGTILRVSGKNLEVYAGETELGDIGASLNQNQLVLNKGYVATKISSYRARNLKQDFSNWKCLQLWNAGF